MNIDEKIKASLEAEQQQLDQVIDDKGLFTMLSNVYQGSMRRWVLVSSLVALLVSIGFIYAAYRFTVTDVLSEQVFWGVWFIAGLLVQIAIKLWIFMEMNRISTLKEIKRSELNIMRLVERE
ncbi:DUF6768 family protein [Pseudoalteromonas sp. MMG005]|uniref:DUF6768 family protein n=1 Tax=Pseudoalteromonas sp. MMG005 TaxID=2822682 RepID=UPI001B39EFBA|nr:DUF6768 family protein [Pseudoalteromonas sp. MMG005]MBQ4845382.1 hypothetical protein [Pseudoalteromonas sp. MMG005]